MKKIFFTILTILFTSNVFSQKLHRKTIKLMGSRFDISVIEKDKPTADRYINQAINEISRIEKLISSWDKNSQTYKINSSAGIKAEKVDKELFNLIQRCLLISKITDGAFDISYASMDKIWMFDGSMTKMPSDKEIKSSISKVSYKNIILNKKNNTVFLKEKGMKIGFGAIGKGYAADKAKSLLIHSGSKAGIINASGDLNVWGKQVNGDKWTIAIINPMNKKHAFAKLDLDNKAIVTSGNYEKFVSFNGIKYSHIINPKTGYPSTGILSVSILAPKAELADALATSIFVMGKDIGLNMINQLKNIDCIIIDDKGKIFKSKQININND